MVSAILATVILSQSSRQPKSDPHPMPAQKVVQVWTRRKSSAALFSMPLATARTLWTASDAQLISLVEKYPDDIVGEARIRERPSMVPVFVKALGRLPGPKAAEAVRGLARLRDKFTLSDADAQLSSALKSSKAAVRWAAAEVIGKRMPSQTAPVLREMLREHPDSRMKWKAAEILASCIGPKAISDIRQARGRLIDDSYIGVMMTIKLAELGDRSAVPEVRAFASQKSNPSPGVMAINALASAYGLREKATLHKALLAGSTQRYWAAHWLWYLGDLSAVPKLRAAAMSEPHDVKNASWFSQVNQTLIAIAKKIERGEKGPDPKNMKMPSSNRLPRH